MNKITNSILVVLLLITLFLGIYILTLKDLNKQQNSRITELEFKYNEAKNVMKSNSDRIIYYADVLKKLEDDYSSYKEHEGDPSYIRYKKEIESILDKEIDQFVNDKPLHNGKWFLSKVRFIGPTIAVVYYEDGHDLDSTLVQITKTDNGYRLEKIE